MYVTQPHPRLRPGFISLFSKVNTMEVSLMMAMAAMLLMMPLAVGMTFAVADKELNRTKALPNGAANVSTDVLDLGHGTMGRLLAQMEFLVSAPAMNTTEMPNSKTMIYSIETDNDVAFGSPTVVNAALITQTGAGGVGCAAASARFRLPTNCERYVRIKATGSAAGNSSTATMTFQPLF
jgi:hypothetical protein